MAMRDENVRQITAAWQPPTPIIGILFNTLKMESVLPTTQQRNLLSTSATVTCMGYNIIATTALFTEGCRNWCLLEPDTQRSLTVQELIWKIDNYHRATSVTSAEWVIVTRQFGTI